MIVPARSSGRQPTRGVVRARLFPRPEFARAKHSLPDALDDGSRARLRFRMGRLSLSGTTNLASEVASNAQVEKEDACINVL